MKHECHEGQEALERFEKGITKLFQAPKSGAKPAAKKAEKRPIKALEVRIKVKRLNRNIRSLQSQLQQTPEVFDAARVNLAVHIFLHVVHRLMDEQTGCIHALRSPGQTCGSRRWFGRCRGG
jgi:hypothetical protein